jgi:tubulin beta
MLSYSLGGGAGSGMGAELLEKVRCEYPDKIILTPFLLPHRSTVGNVLEIYNSCLSLHYNVENSDISTPLDSYSLNRYL